MKKLVAIQGEEGSYHALAAHHLFNGEIELMACNWFDDVFTAVEEDVRIWYCGDRKLANR
jgi:prephenate dehydratase